MWRLATASRRADHGEKHELPMTSGKIAADVIINIPEIGKGLSMEKQ